MEDGRWHYGRGIASAKGVSSIERHAQYGVISKCGSQSWRLILHPIRGARFENREICLKFIESGSPDHSFPSKYRHIEFGFRFCRHSRVYIYTVLGDGGKFVIHRALLIEDPLKAIGGARIAEVRSQCPRCAVGSDFIMFDPLGCAN
jgi:hypothetical protein